MTITNQKIWLKLFAAFFAISLIVGCGDGDAEEVSASFETEMDATNFLTVTFTNFSENATSYDWDFGDGNSSSDENPSHTYNAAGSYTVVLTASNSDGDSDEATETITISDPLAGSELITGGSSKTWKLWREGVSMSVGSSADSPTEFWPGLTNNGARPCLYQHEFTFTSDGTFTFDDKGEFWAEFGLFNNTGCTENTTEEACLEAIPANMINECGDDVSAWLSGTHSFEYDDAAGTITLNGLGAWIGIPKLATDGETLVPLESVTAQVSVEEFTGFDVMTVVFDYGGVYWPIKYASYSDSSLEPELNTGVPTFGEDLPDASPSSLEISFLEEGVGSLVNIESGSLITFGVEDPADASATCGEFMRVASDFQELQLQTTPERNDINFENLSTISLEVYFPSANDYTGTLTKNVVIGVADRSQTEQWWTDLIQYEQDGSSFPEDEWVTITFDLNAPNTVVIPENGATPFERNDFDMIFINIGGSGHSAAGTYFVRNFSIQ